MGIVSQEVTGGIYFSEEGFNSLLIWAKPK